MSPVDIAQYGGGEYTLQEVAEALGVTKERIRQIEATAIQKLRTYFKRNPNEIELTKDTIYKINKPSQHEPHCFPLLYEIPEDFMVCEAENIHIILAEFDSLFNRRAK